MYANVSSRALVLSPNTAITAAHINNISHVRGGSLLEMQESWFQIILTFFSASSTAHLMAELTEYGHHTLCT